ncbi:MAG TPA: tetratricopeptide repeat protein [Myxococcota bacterium]|nr:tetratricopeptide repeat protein [Myxococcota bacterium]
MRAYSQSDVARLFKVSPARLRSWERAELVGPSVVVDSEPAYEYQDLLCVRAVLDLLDRGVPLRRIRRSVASLRRNLPEMDRPARALHMWHEGSGRMVLRHQGLLLEPSGQTVLDLGGEALGNVTVLARPDEEPADPASEWFELGCRKDTDPETYEDAIAAYRRALEIDPEFTDAHCNLGAVLYNDGRRDEARVCFERALQLDAGHLESNLNLANILEEENRNEAALQHYKAALRADPLRSDVHLNLALLYEKLGLRRKARSHWRAYLQREPDGHWSDVARSRLEEE